MKEGKVSTHQEIPSPTGAVGVFETQRGAQRKGAPKAKWRLHHRDYTKQDFSAEKKAPELTVAHSEGELGEEAQVWRASPQEKTRVDCEDALGTNMSPHEADRGKFWNRQTSKVIPMEGCDITF